MLDREELLLESATFFVPSLKEHREALDLSNALNAVSGVARISVNLADHTISITFSGDYADADSLGRFIEQTGYPIQK